MTEPLDQVWRQRLVPHREMRGPHGLARVQSGAAVLQAQRSTTAPPAGRRDRAMAWRLASGLRAAHPHLATWSWAVANQTANTKAFKLSCSIAAPMPPRSRHIRLQHSCVGVALLHAVSVLVARAKSSKAVSGQRRRSATCCGRLSPAGRDSGYNPPHLLLHHTVAPPHSARLDMQINHRCRIRQHPLMRPAAVAVTTSVTAASL